MNDSSITFNETEGKETAESGTWQLMVVVVVLGTLVGMVVMVAGMWVCVVCSRRGGRLGKRKWREQEGTFPPPQREMVELGRLPASSSHHRLDLPPDVNNNYSGISRGLGLGVSYPAQQIPSLPSPQSWTPSPPFDPQQIQVPPKRLRMPQPESGANPAAVGGANEGGLDVGSALYGSRARTSPYNPRYNTFVTDYSSRAPSIRTHSSYHTLGVDPERRGRKIRTHEQWETLSDHYARKRSRSPVRKTYKRLPRHRRHRTNELGEGGRWNQNPRIYLQDPSENTIDLLREGSSSEPPDACSSRHGTPHRHHHSPQISRSASHLNPSRARPLHGFTSEPLQDSRTGSDVDSGYRQEDHNPPVRHKRSTRPRLQMESKTRPLPPAHRPHWIKHHQAGADHGLWQLQRQPCSTALCSQQDQHAEHDQVVARRFALKYGFCPTCGVQRSLKKRSRNPDCVPYGRQLKSRYTQTEGEEFNSLNNNYDLTHDPTPSMSWDNLTPDPSPVLTNTLEDTRALETEAAAAAAADDDGGGCGGDDVSSHAGAYLDRFCAGAMAFGITYTGESSSSNGA